MRDGVGRIAGFAIVIGKLGETAISTPPFARLLFAGLDAPVSFDSFASYLPPTQFSAAVSARRYDELSLPDATPRLDPPLA